MLRLRFVAATSLLLSLSSLGCDRAINSMTQSPDFRKGVTEKARSSCLTSANNSIKIEKTPQVEAKLNSYCDCIATRGMGQFSNADLVNIGIKGIASMTPDQKAKMDKAVSVCQAEAFHP